MSSPPKIASETKDSSSDVLPSSSKEETSNNVASPDKPLSAAADDDDQNHHHASDDHHTPPQDNLDSQDKPSKPDEKDPPSDDDKPSKLDEKVPEDPPPDASPSKPDEKAPEDPPSDDNPSKPDPEGPPSDDNPSKPDPEGPPSDDKPSKSDEKTPIEDNHDKPSPDDKQTSDNFTSHHKLSETDENSRALGDKQTAASENDNVVASHDKSSAAANEDDGTKASEIQHLSSAVLASRSDEITQAEEEDDLPPRSRHPKPRRSKSEPIPDVTETDSKPSQSKTDSLCNLIGEELKYMRDDPKKLKKYGTHIEEELNEAFAQLRLLQEALDSVPESGAEHDEEMKELTKELHELRKIVTKLKAKFPPKAKIHSMEKELSKAGEPREASRSSLLAEKRKPKLPGLYNNSTFETSGTFRDFEWLYNKLDNDTKKLCLLCFSIFPEGAKIKTRFLRYWWMAEEFITSEETAVEFLQEFAEKGFIMPVPEKPGFKVHSYKVHPMARIVLISLAERARAFDFDEKGQPIEKFSRSLQACLVGQGLSEIKQLEKLHMLFNVKETILEFNPAWFLKMENINILYLGRWQSEEQHHIEIENSEFLDGLQHLKFLKFLSLQGVSRVLEIPDSIRKLGRLVFLDLRACHNLETIPTGIGALKSLKYLDMSDCYLIEHIPKELSLLENLVVLKGFVVSPEQKKEKKSCTLKDLSKLERLKKLSIYTGVQEFPLDKDIEALGGFKGLESLTIAWGSAPDKEGKNKSQQKKAITESADKKTEGKGKSQQQKAITESADSKTLDKQVTKKVKFVETASPEYVRNEGVQEERKKPSDAAQMETPRAVDSRNLGDSRDHKTAKPQKTLTRRFLTFKADTPLATNEGPSLPETLKKLDLKCYPQLPSPHWLKPKKLKQLEKLYIRGGKLRDLGNVYDWEGDTPRFTKNTWKEVRTLRLKFLGEMEIRWKDLCHLFPCLTYLEKVNCPKLTLFPCDESGVWIDETKSRIKQEKPSVSH